MSNTSRRRSLAIVVILIALICLLLLLLVRCQQQPPALPLQGDSAVPPAPAAPSEVVSPLEQSETEPEPAEVLTPATLTAPERVMAGAAFTIEWTGPNNQDDYITIVPTGAPADAYTSYRETSEGPSIDLTAPIEPGAYEIRYVTGRSRTILASIPVEIVAAEAALDAPAEITLGATLEVTWSGPDNEGDYITIVPMGGADDAYASYANTETGSPVTVTAPAQAGQAELRYVSGQGRTVLARRLITVLAPTISLAAPPDAIAGTTIEVIWSGPNNAGDYITLVPTEFPDGQYANYTNTTAGSPMKLLVPIMDGDAELRYMSGQGRTVLARIPLKVVAAKITLSAPAQCAPEAQVSITWTGPNNPGDYITIVPKSTPDGNYASYTNTSAGSPLSVKAPKEPGDAEIRYMTGQGSRVLARVPLSVVP